MTSPWMKLAEGELGTKEIPGDGNNPRVVAYFSEAGHPEIHDDETAWCAAFVGAMLKRAGYPNSGSLAARSYLTYGVGIPEPQPGCIVVFRRGNSSWEGHVAFCEEDQGSHVKVLGGNQRDMVCFATYPKSSVLGYRMPIAPTIKALRKAGSTEVAAADNVQIGAGTVGTVGALAGGAAQTAPDPAPVIPQVDPSLTNAAEHFDIAQKLHGGLNAVLELCRQNWWLALVLAGVVAWLVARWWKQKRLARHVAGQPLSSEV